ncbi:MAG: choice-of-anchor L domain-containing protein [Spirochaetales bacterium]|nr:choice-of-anchor L domain-containing protein [Spirochaetales bacterium]
MTSPEYSYDRMRLEFTFILLSGYDGIQFSFVFGTEEYLEGYGTTIAMNDAMGIFLNDVINGKSAIGTRHSSCNDNCL